MEPETPLVFEENRGQFLARGRGYFVHATEGELVLALDADTSLRLRTRSGLGRPRGSCELPGKVHYLRGRDPAGWRRNVPTYARLSYPSIYPGIDLVVYGRQQRCEYDLVVAPGADPSCVELGYEGADGLRVEADGSLVIKAGVHELVQPVPVAYQEGWGGRQPVAARYVLRGGGLGFAVGDYDRSRTLVIDPLLYSTYAGGAGSDRATGLTLDSAGNAYVFGHTLSDNYPTTAGALQAARAGSVDVFVTKLDPAGAVVYSTYLGGSDSDTAARVAVDAAGSAYLFGSTSSDDLPTTAGAFQPARAGTLNSDTFVAKLNAAGSALDYCTYLGGTSAESPRDIVTGGGGEAFLVGQTSSTNFPVTAGAFQSARSGTNDAFLARLNATGTALVCSTYLGGSGVEVGTGAALDSSGNMYAGGSTTSNDFPTTAGTFQPALAGGTDAFVAKLNAAGSALVYSTYLGGSALDRPGHLVVDAAGEAWIGGVTQSGDLPLASAFQGTLAGGSDAFVARLNAAGSVLVYSTYLGGADTDEIHDLALDAAGAAYATGETDSANFPVLNAFQSASAGGTDAFVCKLSPAGSSLAWSTYLGGTGNDIAAAIATDAGGSARVAGRTGSANFPTQSPFQGTPGGSTDAFVTRLDAAGSGASGGGGGSPPAPNPPPIRRRVDLTPQSTSLSGPPGSTQVTTLTLTNSGNAADTFTLAASWRGATLSPPSLTLGAGASAQFTVTLTLPAPVGLGTQVQVVAASTADPTVTGAATLEVSVSAPPPVSFSLSLPAGYSPLAFQTQDVLTLATTGLLFRFTGSSYEPVTVPVPYEAYWIFNATASTLTYSGTGVQGQQRMKLRGGWNLVTFPGGPAGSDLRAFRDGAAVNLEPLLVYEIQPDLSYRLLELATAQLTSGRACWIFAREPMELVYGN